MGGVVTQCENGHFICSECCKKVKFKGCPSCSRRVGHIRNLAMEKVLESLQVACKHAAYGCKDMLKLHEREWHECMFRPFLCPVAGCLHMGSALTLPQHLTEEHQVGTLENNHMRSGALCIRMEPSDRFVMVKTAKKEIFLLHRQQESEGLGDSFFCTAFGAHRRCYSLKVTHSCGARVHSMRNVPAYHIRDWANHDWNGDTIFFPKNDKVTRAYDVVLEDLNCLYDSEGSDTDEDTDEVDDARLNKRGN